MTKNIKINKRKLERIEKHCIRIKEIQEGIKPIDFKFNSLQTYIVDRVNHLEELLHTLKVELHLKRP